MGQPVRKVIAEAHPEAIEKKIYTLIIDGNNVLRKSFTDTKINSDGVYYGAIFQFLLQIRIMLQKKAFDYVYVIFDDEGSGVMRYKIYNDYKANRDKHYENFIPEEEKSEYWKKYEATLSKIENSIYKRNKRVKSEKDSLVDDNIVRVKGIIKDCLEELFIRCIESKDTEGDDLIAYYVKNKLPEERIVIMSGDHDLTQLINKEVCVFDPNTNVKKFISVDNFKKERGIVPENVVLTKIFLGDSSDNIKGITGLSEKRLMELVPDIANRPVSVSEVKERAKELINERINEKKKPLKWHENIVNGTHNGNYDGDFYEINKKLIDLSEPLLTKSAKEEIDSVMYAPMDPEGRSFGNLFKIIKENKIEEIIDEDRFSNFFNPFKILVDKEIKRYKES